MVLKSNIPAEYNNDFTHCLNDARVFLVIYLGKSVDGSRLHSYLGFAATFILIVFSVKSQEHEEKETDVFPSCL